MTENAKKIADELVQDLGSAHADRIGIQLAKAGFGFVGTSARAEQPIGWISVSQVHGGIQFVGNPELIHKTRVINAPVYLHSDSIPTTPKEKSDAWLVHATQTTSIPYVEAKEQLFRLLISGRTIDELYDEIKE